MLVTKYDEILVTEGYMDVASLHQFEFTNAVASMGTAFSEDQIQTLFITLTPFTFALTVMKQGEQLRHERQKTLEHH